MRGTIDCIIAQTCITAGLELLSTDQDFAGIARHTPLRLCAVRVALQEAHGEMAGSQIHARHVQEGTRRGPNG